MVTTTTPIFIAMARVSGCLACHGALAITKVCVIVQYTSPKMYDIIYTYTFYNNEEFVGIQWDVVIGVMGDFRQPTSKSLVSTLFSVFSFLVFPLLLISIHRVCLTVPLTYTGYIPDLILHFI